MTTVQRVAQIFGIVFILVALVGFYTGGMNMEADPATAPALFGTFPVNLLHNIVHLLFGLWGLAASRSWSGAKQYAQIAGVLYLVLAGLGFVAPDGFGFVPLGGNDIYLHLVLGLALAAVGFTAKPETITPSGSTI
ncbi:MAG TPA: DUF4383 domain-containing protein [Gemmatimonadaceae bacterium]|nr:DUF4383 domain-containing protein [Gemmatimonadaceae bacterium]